LICATYVRLRTKSPNTRLIAENVDSALDRLIRQSPYEEWDGHAWVEPAPKAAAARMNARAAVRAARAAQTLSAPAATWNAPPARPQPALAGARLPAAVNSTPRTSSWSAFIGVCALVFVAVCAAALGAMMSALMRSGPRHCGFGDIPLRSLTLPPFHVAQGIASVFSLFHL
jgi:hypothetical protein